MMTDSSMQSCVNITTGTDCLTPADRKGQIRSALLACLAESFELDGVPTTVGFITYVYAPLFFEEEQKAVHAVYWITGRV